MKTLDEVITANECCDHCEPDSNCKECPYISVPACALERESDALHWLKGYRAHIELDKLRDKCETKNDPLSWDELRQMEGKPIWVEQHHGDTKGWLLILRKCDDVVTCTTKHGNSFYLYKANYGEKWQAYRKERNENAG